ncbi:MAG: DUF4912 domain-containing protein [Treponema sp.]|nr:DUF4912 domain-containing protein [Treponema sp.]MCL2237880.1 DUF4912 domain-containing protein [Treponema sp.]
MENGNTPVSRQWLESLSTDELIKLADNYGIDIPPGLDRIFIIEEVLEVSSMEMQETSGNEIAENPVSETASLPKQYNISFIDVIIRDPLWVFAFWEVKGQDREIHESADDFKCYCLRVIPLNEDGTEPKSIENSFTIQVSAQDSARYLGFAEEGDADCGCYAIKLCAVRGDNEVSIAASAPFFLPRHVINYHSENEAVAEMNRSPLLRLSGIQNLSITKNTDRWSRNKKV